MVLRDARIGDIVFNPADRSLWGLRHLNGYVTLVRIPEPYTSWNQIHTFPFGRVPFDLDISADGTMLSASVGEINGEQTVQVFRIADLEPGATPTATHRTVSVDLREDWPKALTDSGFDPTQPTSWSAEGLLIYLPPQAQDALFDTITALSAPGSRLATEHVPDLTAFTDERSQHLRDRLKQLGSDIEMADLVYQGKRNNPVDYLRERGWEVTALPNREAYAANGFEFPDDEMSKIMGDLSYVRAVFTG